MNTVKHLEHWPPQEYALPSTIEAIEHGRIVQSELFTEQPLATASFQTTPF